MSQPLNPPSSPIPGAIYTEDLTGISWVWTGVAWIEGGPSSNYSAQIKTGMALTPGFYSGLSTTTTGGSGTNLSAIGTQYGATAPLNPSFGQTWIDTSDSLRPVTYVWTDPGSWTKTSDGTTNTYVQSLAPTDHEIGDSWYNTSSSELNIWDGAQWRQIVGTGGGGTATSIQSYATTPAVQAEGSIVYNTTEDKVYVSTGAAWVELDFAPDEDTHSILAIAAPTVRANGDPLVSGDQWIDTSSNTINYYSGTAWVRLASATVGDTHSFWNATAPTQRPDTTPLVAGDFWVDSNTAAVYVYTGSVWSPIVNSQDNNTNSIVSAASPTQRPTASDPTLQTGDLWVNSGDFSINYWTGVAWIPLTAQTSSAGDKHSFTGATIPTIVQRPDGNPLLAGDQWINTVTNVISYWTGSGWVAVTAAATDTHSFTGTGVPSTSTRPDGSALQDGDFYVNDTDNSAYFYDLSATAWKAISTGATGNDTHSFTGTGTPTLTQRPDATALQDGDFYVNDTDNTSYYYDLSVTTWKQIGGGSTVNQATPTIFGTVLGYTGTGGYGPYGATYLGQLAGSTSTTGTYNTILGSFSGTGISTGTNNTFVGAKTAAALNTGSFNTAVGFNAFSNATTATYSTALGPNALSSASTATRAIAIGSDAGKGMIGSVDTIAIGSGAGMNSFGSSNNVFIGTASGKTVTTNNTTIIGKYDETSTVADGTLILARNGLSGSANDVFLRINESSAFGIPTASTGVAVNYGTAGQVLTSQGATAPPTWTASSAGTDYIGMMNNADPSSRPDGSAFLDGDTYANYQNSTPGLASSHYYWVGDGFEPIGNVTHHANGAPTITVRRDGKALVVNDLYIDGTTGNLYRWNGTTWQQLAGGGSVSAATPTSLGTVYGDANTAYNASLGYLAGVNQSGPKYGTTLIGIQAGQQITTGRDLTFIGAGSGSSATSTSNEITIIGSYNGTGLTSGDYVLAPASSYGAGHTKKYLQFNVGGAIGVPTASQGSTVDYGTAGQILTSQGLSNPPTWAAAGGGTDYQSSATNPSLRSDSSALQTGDIWFESDTNRTYFWNGTSNDWQANGTHTFYSTSDPASFAYIINNGDAWYNSSGGTLRIRESTFWILI